MMKAILSWRLSILTAASLILIPCSARGQVPDPPQNVQPAWIHGWPGDYARLTWDSAPGATGYNVYRFNDATTAWEIIFSGVTNTLVLDDTAGSAERSYQVSATSPEGESAPSPIVVTHDNEVLPTLYYFPPGMNPGTLTPTTATFRWVADLVSGCDGMLELATNAVDFTTVYFNPAYEGSFTVVVSNLLPATLYTYRMTSVGTNRAGTAGAQSFWTPDINHPPVAADFTFGPVVDPYPIIISLAATDPDGTWPLQFFIVTAPTNGTLSEVYGYDYTGVRYVDYTPNPGARGADSFQYVASDGELDSAPATVSFPSIWLNRPPQPVSFATNTLEDVPLALDLAVTDPDGDALTFEFFALYGSITGSPPNVVYLPAPEFNGAETVFYNVYDGYSGGFAQGVIDLVVEPVNDPPTALSGAVETAEDTPAPVVPAVFDIEGDPTTVTIVTPPAHGVLSGAGPTLTYTPNANFAGTDTFTFSASDGMATSAVATTTILVTPVNDAPVAFDAAVEAVEDDWSTVVKLSGQDVDGDALTYAIATPPAHGTLARLFYYVSDLWIYRPVANYNGPDSFTFTVTDGTATSAPATVSINVLPVNDPPVAAGQTLTTQEDVALPLTVTASDLDGDVLVYTIAVPPAHGTLSGAGPDYVYTPAANFNGTDQFVFSVTDAGGVSRSATNDLTILPVADPPVANPQSVTTPYNTPLDVFLTGSDPDGDLQGFVVTSTPANGVLMGTPPWLTFIPDTGFSGVTSFQFAALDSASTSPPASVTITVQAALALPAAPSGLTATVISSSQINLSWTDNAGWNEDGFKVERSSNGNTWTQIATTGPNTTSYASTGLSGNRTYYYRVRAYNVLGDSAYSNTASARTLK